MKNLRLIVISSGTILTILFVIIIFSLRSNTPSQPTKTLPPPSPTQTREAQETSITSRFDTNTSSSQISYIGPALNIPDSLPEYSTSDVGLDAFANQLAQSFNLTPHQSQPNYWHNSDFTQTLSTNSANHTFGYSNSTQNTTDQEVQLEQALSSAENYLLGLQFPNTQLDRNSVVYLDSRPEPAPTNPGQAAYIDIPFYFTLNDYPVLPSNQATKAQSIRLNNQYQIVKLNSSPPFSFSKNPTSLTIISLDAALSQIQRGNMVILNATLPNTFIGTGLGQFETIALNQSQLQYRIEPENSLARPYYYFSGVAEKDNKQYFIELITPAYN